MTVYVQYFAVLREQAGIGTEIVETEATTVSELYHQLQREHGFTLSGDLVKAAANNTFLNADDPIPDGGTLTFIPPVAGA